MLVAVSNHNLASCLMCCINSMKEGKKGCACIWFLPLFAPFPQKVIHIAIFSVKKGHMVQNYLSSIWYESIFPLQ